MKRIFIVVAILAALVGCTSNQVLISLNLAVVTTDALAGSLAATGQIDPAIAAQIVDAISPLPAAAQEIVAELSSTDSNAVRALKITAALTPILERIKGLPPTAQAITSACLAAWQAFLAAYPVPMGVVRVGGPGPSTKFDANELRKIGAKAGALSAKVGALR